MLTEKLLSFTLLGAEWVLWLLLVLSVMSVGVMVDRLIMVIKNSVDITELSEKIQRFLKEKDDKGLDTLLSQYVQNSSSVLFPESHQQCRESKGVVGMKV